MAMLLPLDVGSCPQSRSQAFVASAARMSKDRLYLLMQGDKVECCAKLPPASRASCSLSPPQPTHPTPAQTVTVRISARTQHGYASRAFSTCAVRAIERAAYAAAARAAGTPVRRPGHRRPTNAGPCAPPTVRRCACSPSIPSTRSAAVCPPESAAVDKSMLTRMDSIIQVLLHTAVRTGDGPARTRM